jgi:two-component system sensor histidine kinase KdpD
VIDLPSDLPQLYVDPQRIEAVLRNLIENAAKYAGDNSPITISAGIEGQHMVVRVRDQGPGIPPEYSERIFESFYRLKMAGPLTLGRVGSGDLPGFCKRTWGRGLVRTTD